MNRNRNTSNKTGDSGENDVIPLEMTVELNTYLEVADEVNETWDWRDGPVVKSAC